MAVRDEPLTSLHLDLPSTPRFLLASFHARPTYCVLLETVYCFTSLSHERWPIHPHPSNTGVTGQVTMPIKGPECTCSWPVLSTIPCVCVHHLQSMWAKSPRLYKSLLSGYQLLLTTPKLLVKAANLVHRPGLAFIAASSIVDSVPHAMSDIPHAGSHVMRDTPCHIDSSSSF